MVTICLVNYGVHTINLFILKEKSFRAHLSDYIGPPIMLEIEPRMVTIIFGAHMNNLFIINMMILVLVKWPYGCPPIMLTTEPRMVNTHSQILNMCFFSACS